MLLHNLLTGKLVLNRLYCFLNYVIVSKWTRFILKYIPFVLFFILIWEFSLLVLSNIFNVDTVWVCFYHLLLIHLHLHRTYLLINLLSFYIFGFLSWQWILNWLLVLCLNLLSQMGKLICHCHTIETINIAPMTYNIMRVWKTIIHRFTLLLLTHSLLWLNLFLHGLLLPC